MEYSQEDLSYLDEIYNSPELMEQYLSEQMLMSEQMNQEYSVLNDCLQPTMSQAFTSISPILCACIVLRLVTWLKAPRILSHALSALSGLAVLWNFYNSTILHVVIPSLVGYLALLLLTKNKRKGTILMVMSLLYLLMCEFTLVDKVEWNKVRGSVMIVCMKTVSFSFDSEQQGIYHSPQLVEYFGYILNPGCIIFGPFIPFSDHLQMFEGYPMDLAWFFNITMLGGISFATLGWSTCGINTIEQYGLNYRWLTAFTEAMAFRFSHYFVSYSSELSCVLMGIGTLQQGLSSGPEQDAKNQSEDEYHEASHPLQVKWKRPVSRLLHVELPRSLVDVVTNWNLPMHYWLKNYVFRPCRFLGVLPAILITYLASSLLHGLNFQLSAILLSIGAFAFVEHSMRSTLADTFKACVGARKCREECTHVHKQGDIRVILVNSAFSLFAMWNLAYLGCLFDNNAVEQDQGYSMAHALHKWSNLHYASHWVMLAVLIISKLMKDGNLFSVSSPAAAKQEYTVKDKKKTN